MHIDEASIGSNQRLPSFKDTHGNKTQQNILGGKKMFQKFFKCDVCGNLIGMIHSSGVPMVCCGQNMTELKANASDGAAEKHVPSVTVDGDKVTVKIGDVPHPMLPEHYIQWVYVKTEQGGQRKELKPGDAPQVEFTLTGDRAIAVYEYCNLHGLWIEEL
jgi:superoxide reductase